MNDHSSSRQISELWVLVNQVRDVILKAREKELRPVGVTAVQAAALSVIETIGDGATAAQMAQWLFREPNSVSGLLNRMEKDGLISRSRDFPIKSLATVKLTEKGQQAYSQSVEKASIRNAIGILSKEEQQLLGSFLRRVRDEGLKQLLGDLKPPFP